MDNHIFRKLSDAIERPCRNKDWFGMAEQAINTIYALAEHPDKLCDSIIRKLTIRAFNRGKSSSPKPTADPDGMDQDEPQEREQEPETVGSGRSGDAFELSQLLFVVGHVAIKHIVYLELVERELKRQKDEKEKGIYSHCTRCQVINALYSREKDRCIT